MTKERFRQLAKQLHPDTSGTGSTTRAFRVVVEAWNRRKKRPKCWCGVTINQNAERCRIHRYIMSPENLLE